MARLHATELLQAISWAPLALVGLYAVYTAVRYARARLVAHRKGDESLETGDIRLDDSTEDDRPLFSLFITEQDILEVEGLLQDAHSGSMGDELRDGVGSGAAETTEETNELTRDKLEALLPPPPIPLIALPFLELVGWSFVLLRAVLSKESSGWVHAASHVSALHIAPVWLFAFARELGSRSRLPPFSSLLLFLLLLVNASINTVQTYHIMVYNGSPEAVPWAIVLPLGDLAACAQLVLVIIRMPLRIPLASVLRDQARGDQRARPHSPEDENSLLGALTYSWINPMLPLAHRRRLLPSDIWSLALANRAEVLSRRFSSLTSKTLTRRLLRASARDILIDVSLKLLAVSLMYLRPYFIKCLLERLSEDEAERSELGSSTPAWSPRDQAYLYALGAFLAMIGRTLAQQQHFHHARQIGMRLRSELTVAVYEKALRRKDVAGRAHAVAHGEDEAEESATRGKVVNLISDDTNKVLRMGCDSHLIYGAPLEVIWGLALLYSLIGWSMFVGFAVILLSVPIHYWLGKRATAIGIAKSNARDRRQASLQELISAIRSIKFFGWSRAWSAKVGEKRNDELAMMIREWINVQGFIALSLCGTAIVPIVSLVCYVKFQHKPLTIAVAFTSIELFQMIRVPVMQVPSFWIKIIQCTISIARIDAFLGEEEVEPHVTPEVRKHHKSTLGFANATLQYSADTAFRLKDLAIEFPKGKLTVISGPTGSGKTSMLLALLGELQVVEGKVFLPPAVSFAAQHPWLESCTVRQTVLFGSPFDQARYDSTIDACALRQDIQNLPDGEDTHIGERGVSLSGGQKARLALARAIYAPNDVLLLDDVLSAVDSRTARHLSKHITGPLVQPRTIILVTHHTSLVLPGAHHHVVMEGGRIVFNGPVEPMSARPSLPLSIMGSYRSEVPHEDSSAHLEDEDPAASVPTRTTGVEAETWGTGKVSGSMYTTYLSKSSYSLWAIIVFLLVAMPVLGYADQFWLRNWAEASAGGRTVDVNYYALGYTFLSLIHLDLASVVVIQAINALLCVAEYRACRTLFAELLHRVVHARPRWYDITPVGRILNRFTNDVAVIDGELAAAFSNFAGMIISLVISFGINMYILPLGIIPILGVGAVYLYIFSRWLNVSRDLNRIAATTASPLFSGFQQVLVGISTIRAFGREKNYRRHVCKVLDDTLSMWYASATIDVWIQYRTQLLSSATLLAAAILSVYTGLSPGLAGIAINASQAIIGTLDGLCNTYARLVLSMNSLERIVEYLSLPQEPEDGISAPAAWPSAATKGLLIEVQDLTIKYAPELPATLKGVSFSVMPGERVAIVGRTGAGKSTLAMSLLRVVDPASGRILIDALDITSIALDDLRSRVTLLPQDAVLFSGTLRYNLDPFDEHSDEECLDAMRRVHIIEPTSLPKPSVSSVEAFASEDSNTSTTLSLASPVAEGGENFSQGQRQLIAMGRALLRNPVILILDESTASLDADLDRKLQATIREQFQQTAVITIAHRLRTIVDNSRIIVLDAGKIVECDTPQALLQDEHGLFTEMCRQSGEYEELREIAMMN
ncbi:BZ3500_MvSof-1268-A1-R1_Chr2-2g05153 [Microbotryum saponariae]|uniref:BZ3500_MvSof-1268-A1-R1_Chr2-2g05153 protein n=1 Tax=Microbotryum saponariae TaxID=289078 RepID=A0A2X0K6I7_9BASI|nr:BZ3500_MvSof-1268-A1-R1_Chr2-2g05153 [Microbotryum saponariae]SDA00980.1 BZ3501_MvSof-1269-A2-R1_Chr2-2g04827 [Microbotryum saponariae]